MKKNNFSECKFIDRKLQHEAMQSDIDMDETFSTHANNLANNTRAVGP